MMLAFTLALLQADADAVLARFSQFASKAQTLTADVRMEKTGWPSGMGRLSIQYPDRLSLEYKSPQIDYRYAIMSGVCTEIDRIRKQFDEYEWLGELSPGWGRISTVSHFALPHPLLARTLTVGIPPQAKFQKDGVAVVDGAPAEWVSVKYSDPGGEYTTRALVAQDGRLLRHVRTMKGVVGTEVTTLIITNYRTGSTLAPSVFQSDIPAAYEVYALPRVPYPLEIGRFAPLSGWRSADTDAPVQLSPDGHLLLALVAKNCAPSELAITELAGGGSGYRTQLLSASSQRGEAPAESLYDPSGKLPDKLSMLGTPTFFLVGPGGVVKGIWHGYNKGRKQELDEEIAKLVAGSEQE